MKRKRWRFVAFILILIGTALILSGFIKFLFFPVVVDKEEEKDITLRTVFQIVTDHTGGSSKDLKFIEITDKGEYKILNQKTATSYQKQYYIVNLETKDYYMDTVVSRGSMEEY